MKTELVPGRSENCAKSYHQCLLRVLESNTFCDDQCHTSQQSNESVRLWYKRVTEIREQASLKSGPLADTSNTNRAEFRLVKGNEDVTLAFPGHEVSNILRLDVREFRPANSGQKNDTSPFDLDTLPALSRHAITSEALTVIGSPKPSILIPPFLQYSCIMHDV